MHIGTGDLDERPNHDSGPGVHTAQTTRPGATKQPQQKCFGLVVFGMRHRNRRRAWPIGRTRKKLVPRVMRRVLERNACFPRTRGDIDTLDV
jgi:hypothetical protein